MHIALVTDDFEGSYQRHKAMGIVCIEELQKDIYYVEDPDGYEIAVVPAKFHPANLSISCPARKRKLGAQAAACAPTFSFPCVLTAPAPRTAGA